MGAFDCDGVTIHYGEALCPPDAMDRMLAYSD